VTNFADRLIESIVAQKSYLCVGLDPQLRYIPKNIRENAVRRYGMGYVACAEAIITFNKTIIDVTAKFAACYKPQSAFYEPYGSEGIRALGYTINYARSTGLPVIFDGKREDGGDTSEQYAGTYLGEIDVLDETGEVFKRTSPLNSDAITITPWIDDPNFSPFVEAAKQYGTGAFVVTKTSFNPPSRLQDILVNINNDLPGLKDVGKELLEVVKKFNLNGIKAWMVLAKIAVALGELAGKGTYGYAPIGVVMGATFPQEAEIMKAIVPHGIKLVPGFKAQSGTADDAVVSVNDDGFGFIANSSRGTNYAYHPVSKSRFQDDSRFFATAASLEAQEEQVALNASVLHRIGKLPW
jgi:orotidine-5'-phosphate decarboxylase